MTEVDAALRTLAITLATAPDAAARIDAAEAEARDREGLAALKAAAAHLRADPADAERLFQLERTLFGRLPARAHHAALRAIGLRADELLPLLSAAATGRGHQRRDPGRSAANLLAALVAHELLPRERVTGLLRGRVAERDKNTRTNAAQALTEIDLATGSAAVTLELGQAKDGAIVEGAIRGIRAIAGDVRMERCEPPLPLERLAPVLRKALAPSSPHVSSALDAVNDWSFRPDTASEAQPLVPALETLVRKGKPDARRFAGDIVSRVRHARKGVAREPFRPRSFTTYPWRTIEGDACFTATNTGMSILRELMREVGAISEPGRQRAMTEGPAVDPGAAPLAKFVWPSAAIVTPDECRVIATRLLAHLPLVREVATFFDDAPSGAELTGWVTAWADFHARAAALGGHRLG